MKLKIRNFRYGFFYTMKIIQANIAQLQDLTPLFNAYRVFYNQESDLRLAERFLSARIDNGESIIFIAYDANKAIGFTQLYPIFSSVSMETMLVLNDLYVVANYRSKGVGKALIDAAKAYCTKAHYKGLSLETAKNNPAQHLYEREEFTKDDFLHYNWSNPKK